MAKTGGAKGKGVLRGIALAALGYFLAQEVSFFFPDSQRVLMAIWPAAGVGLAAFLLLPRPAWPALALAVFAVGNLANLLAGRPLLLSLGFMVCNLLESWLSALLVLRLSGRVPRFDRLVEVGALGLAAVFVNAATALLAAAVAALYAGAEPLAAWLGWWISDGLGLLILAPVIAGRGVLGDPRRRPTPLFLLEYLLFLALWLAFSYLSFYRPPGPGFAAGHPYFLIVLMIWPAYRFSVRTIGVSALLLGILALLSPALALGPSPLGGTGPLGRLQDLELFLAVLTGAAYAFSAAFSELRRALERSEGQRAELERAERERGNSEERARAVLDGAADGILLADAGGRIRECNEACSRILGRRREELEGRSLEELFGAEGLEALPRGEGNAGPEPLQDRGLLRDDGSRVELEIAARRLASGELVGILRDVTARRFEERCAELALRLVEEEERLSLADMIGTLLEEAERSGASASASFFLIGEDGKTLRSPFWSPHALEEESLGEEGSEGRKGEPLWRRALREGRGLLDNASRPREAALPLLEGGKVRAILCLRGKARDYDGEDFAKMGRLGEIARELVVRKETRSLLEETEERFALVFRHSPVPTLISRADTGFIVDANEAFCSLFGYELEELVGRSALDLGLYVSNEERLLLRRLLEGGTRNLLFEPQLRTKAGAVVETRSSVESVFIRGEPYFVKQIEDVTERKRQLAQLRRALEDKEILLRELYHRANNNMQVISALLDFEALELGETRFSRAIEDTQNRIGALALVNRKLFEAQDLSYINLRDYIDDLLGILAQSHASKHKRLRVGKDLENIKILVDTALPCGLILNELISNVYRHAYPDAEGGLLEVGLKRLEEGRIAFRVADRGVGLPPGFDPARDGKIGLQSVLGLCASQLRATVTFDRTKGLACEVVFSDTIYKARI